MSGSENNARSALVPRLGLPILRTSFVGRKRELEELARLLASSRLVTLTGAAGCGKTRLAQRAAAGVGPAWVDGAHWIELARLADPGLVPQTVARALRVPEQVGHPSLGRVLDALRGKRLLLVLDNCEHLLGACAQLVDALLAETEVSILATSREPLAVMGEMLYPVAPLSVPPRALAAYEPDEIGQFEAVQLFIERAQAVLPSFGLNSENARAVASICQHLDGIPLAIELASARVKVLTVEQIAAWLDQRLDLPRQATQVTYSHHDTLRDAIDWSHDLLTGLERVMLRRLSVFSAGCSLATAETVCAGDGVERGDVFDLLSSLVNKSLVVAETLQRGEARYCMLETIQRYAQAKLIEAGEGPAVQDRHLDCFLRLTEETVSKLRGEYQELWLNWLESEYDNIRSALRWSLESDRLEAGLRIGIALYQFWTIRDYAEEGLAWLERLLSRADERVGLVLRANALAYASLLAGFRRKTRAQEAYGREAAELAEAAGEEGKKALYWALAARAHAARAEGDCETEFTLSQRVIQVARELGYSYRLGMGLTLYSVPAMAVGKYDVARAWLDEGLALLRQMGDPYRIAMALNYCGDLARCERDYSRAQAAYEESIALLRQIGAERDLASAWHNLGHACIHLGDVERAQALFCQTLASHRAHRNRPGMAECLLGFAGLAMVRGRAGPGARLLAAADALGGPHGDSVWAATRLEYQHYLARAQVSLTARELLAEQAAGRNLSLEEAVAYAEDVAAAKPAEERDEQQPDALTPRERTVAALIARARSNEEIAEELVLSKRTVEKHIANIRSKLGFTQRAQIVRWAMEYELGEVGESLGRDRQS